MAVEFRGPKPVVNPISSGPRGLQVASDREVLMRSPDGKETHLFSLSNARDLSNRPHPHKWTFATPLKTVNPMPSLETQKQAIQLEEARRLLREAGELPQENVMAMAGLERKDLQPSLDPEASAVGEQPVSEKPPV